MSPQGLSSSSSKRRKRRGRGIYCYFCCVYTLQIKREWEGSQLYSAMQGSFQPVDPSTGLWAALPSCKASDWERWAAGVCWGWLCPGPAARATVPAQSSRPSSCQPVVRARPAGCWGLGAEHAGAPSCIQLWLLAQHQPVVPEAPRTLGAASGNHFGSRGSKPGD